MKPMPHFLVFLLLFTAFYFSHVFSDLASDRAALLSLRAAVGGRILLWNLTAASPCSSWRGVTCEGHRVTLLRLPGMGLSGQLPLGLGNLTELQTLSLRFNALSGTLPSDLAKLSNLRNLYLQGNFFSGEIPAFLFTMQILVRLNLAGNNFSGEISPNFNNLTRLATLYLEQNQLTGPVPDLQLRGLDQFNVSFNKLNGSIPSRLSGLLTTAFEGNSLCGKPMIPCNGTESDNKLSGGVIAGIAIGSVLGFLLIFLILIILCRRKSSSKTSSTEVVANSVNHREIEIPTEKPVGDIENVNANVVNASVVTKAEAKGTGNKSLVFFGNAARVFDLEDLLKASAEVLGKGTFGTAYKAVLETGLIVAVKRLKEVAVEEAEFREKIEAVGRIDHDNLVPLRAYYFNRDEKLLVYDYMPMGSLSALLHGNKGAGRTPLNWETRSSIALGAARGIAYLHSQGSSTSHGNIKSSNILLTKSYGARVSDFGLAHLAGPSSTPNRIEGYRAPEVTDARKVSHKADVYSFGVLLLELLTGKPPTHALLNEEGVDLPRWVQSVVREEWTAEVFDVDLLRYQNVEEEMVSLLQLAIDCTVQYPDNRPSMPEVISRIEELRHSSSQQNGAGVEFSQQIYSANSGAPPLPKD